MSGSQSTGALTANATLYTHLHGDRRQRHAVDDGLGNPARPDGGFVGEPQHDCERQRAVLTWSATNATSCTASGAWSGAKATSGSQSTGALKANATYSLTCTGSGGSATQSATVSVTSPTPAPTVSLAASPSSIASGGSSTLTWSTTNATSCTASGAWTGSKATSGSQSTGALTANASYSLTCTGTGGSATQIDDGLGNLARSDGRFVGEPEHGCERQQRRLDLVLHQRDGLHRLRCLVGRQGRQRFAVHRRSEGQFHLFADLYG